MHKLAIGLLAIGSMFFIACGGGDGGSGVDRSKQMSNLSPDEVMDHCEWGLEVSGGAGETYDCGDGVTATNSTVAQCVSTYDAEFYATCNLTVGQVEDCFVALDGNPCNLFTAPRCAPFIDCIFSS